MKIYIRENRFLLSVYCFLLLAGTELVLWVGKADLHIWINARHAPWADLLFTYLTHLGDGLFAVLLILVFLFVRFRYAMLLGIAYLVSGGIAQVGKKLLFSEMSRPRVYFDGLAELHFVEGIKIAGSYSFPSGHATTAFALAFICIYLTKNKSLKWLLFGAACVVSFSRVYLSQHFMEDILAGSLLGLCGALMAIFIDGRWKNPVWNRSLMNFRK
jgi:membrane-associated phospholipid phosphatase